MGNSLDMTYIYGLADPTSGTIRYVGKSNNPQARLKDHRKKNGRGRVANWIQSLRAAGLKPALVIIQCVALEEWEEWEKYWVAFYREAGYALLNCADGGAGPSVGNHNMRGYEHTPETRARMKEAHAGLRHSAETIEKIRMAQTPETRAKSRDMMKGNQHTLGYKASPGTRAKQSSASKGRKRAPHSPKTCTKISESKKGKRQTPEQRAKTSIAMMGNQNALGYIHTSEQIAKQSEARKGKKHTQATLEKMSASQMGNQNMLGKHHSLETRAKIGAGNRGRKHTEKARANMCVGQQRRQQKRKDLEKTQTGLDKGTENANG